MRYYVPIITKSCGDGKMVTILEAGWCWKQLTTNMESDGHGVFRRSLSTEANLEFGSNLCDRAAFSRYHAPFSGKSIESDLQKACLFTSSHCPVVDKASSSVGEPNVTRKMEKPERRNNQCN